MINKYHIVGLGLIFVLCVFLLIYQNIDYIKSLNLNNWQNLIVQEKDNNLDQKSYKIIKVVDGDTVEIENGLKIRYLNIDTPETKSPTKGVMCFGKEAEMENKRLVENKNVWLLKDKEDEDKYGRKLRFIFIEKDDYDKKNIENSVNADLIKNGFARSMIIKPNDTYKKIFQEYEYLAKVNNIGLWKSCLKPFEA